MILNATINDMIENLPSEPEQPTPKGDPRSVNNSTTSTQLLFLKKPSTIADQVHKFLTRISSNTLCALSKHPQIVQIITNFYIYQKHITNRNNYP